MTLTQIGVFYGQGGEYNKHREIKDKTSWITVHGVFLCLSVTVTYIAEKIEKKIFSEK